MADAGHAQVPIDWETCRVADCIGERLPAGSTCWAHAGGEDLDAALRALADDRVLHARGVAFTADRLQRVLDAAPKPDEAVGDLRRALQVANLDGSRLPAVRFAHLRCDGEARFEHATFEDARFVEVTFGAPPATGEEEAAAEVGARLPGPMVSFQRATFLGATTFKTVAFHTGANFDDAHVEGDLEIDGDVAHGLTFRDARFGGALVVRARCLVGEVDVIFQRAVFAGPVDVSGLSSRGSVDFLGARFETARNLGPLRTDRRLVMDGSVWRERALIEVSTSRLDCRWARFLSGVELRIQPRGGTDVFLDDADLAEPSVVARTDGFVELDWSEDQSAAEAADPPWPRILSLCGANVAGLTLAGVDLRACRFAGAHNLDRLRLDDVRFGWAPGRGRTRRQVIAEEIRWRQRHSSRVHDWTTVAAWPDDHAPDLLEAEQVAAIYRDLRKGREDDRDEPGATDFYYGEMEMRRAAATDVGERVVLTLYWLLSGYGLRAWRSLVALAAVVVVTGSAFAAWGLDERAPGAEPADLPTGLLVAARAGTAVFSTADVPLTTFGAWLHLGLRLAGPVLLGLAVLAVRGRVKR
jgi:uncharacterized protein YjbI with pentapeptide repeats